MSLQENNHFDSQAIQQINKIMAPIQMPNRQHVLNFKITQLQKVVETLTRANDRLLNKIQNLEQQLNQKSKQQIFQQDYSILQDGVIDVQNMISQYKKQLSQYQQKYKKNINQKQTQINILNQENKKLTKINHDLINQIQNIQDKYLALEQQKNELINQINHLNSKKSKLDSPRYTNKSNQFTYLKYNQDNNTNEFNQEVQRQLQKLIQKLIKQLEYERNIKKKLSEQIKILQKDLLEKQKQINQKKNQIYSLQISSLKNNRPGSSSNMHKNLTHTNNTNTPRKSKELQMLSKSNKQSKIRNFTIMQLMNGCIKLTVRQKLIISLKIIDVFLYKITNGDFSSQILQSLTIWNYSPQNLNVCRVRINRNSQKLKETNQDDFTASKTIWNLAFILDNLFNQTQSKDYDFGLRSQEAGILDIITFILQSQNQNDIQIIGQLKNTIQTCLEEQ